MIEKRSVLKVIVLSIVTLGLYLIYDGYKMTKELNSVYAGTENKAPNYIVVFIISMFTYGFAQLYWFFSFNSMVGFSMKKKYKEKIRFDGTLISLIFVLILLKALLKVVFLTIYQFPIPPIYYVGIYASLLIPYGLTILNFNQLIELEKKQI